MGGVVPVKEGRSGRGVCVWGGGGPVEDIEELELEWNQPAMEEDPPPMPVPEAPVRMEAVRGHSPGGGPVVGHRCIRGVVTRGVGAHRLQERSCLLVPIPA